MVDNMLKVAFTNEKTGTNYVRVNRRIALKAFSEGHTLLVFGRMDNPLSPWSGCSIWEYTGAYKDFGLSPEQSFVKCENSFEFYRSKKPWWYLPESIASKYTK